MRLVVGRVKHPGGRVNLGVKEADTRSKLADTGGKGERTGHGKKTGRKNALDKPLVRCFQRRTEVLGEKRGWP